LAEGVAMTKKTYHEGAEAERKAFKAYLKRQPRSPEVEMALAWIKGRCDRYKKVKGGL
jgi:hypothetical protein